MSTNEGYLPIHTNGTPGTFVVTDPKYGAYGDGVHDDTAAIQAAIDDAQDAGGGVVYLPPGTYLTTSSLAISGNHVALAGAGMFTSTIQVSGSYDGVVLSNAATGTRITSLSITSSATQTAGAGIKADSSGNSVYTTLIDNVYFATYNGLELYYTNTTTILHCRMNCANYGLYCGDNCSIVRFANAEVGAGYAGVFIDGGASSVKLLQLEIFTNTYGVALNAINGKSDPTYVYMYDIECNPGSSLSASPIYFYINNAGEVHLTECWSDGGPQAIQINSGTVTILGGRYGDGASPIVAITGGDATTIVGSSISGSVNQGTGIGITGGGNIRITDVFFNSFGDALGYAVSVASTYNGQYPSDAGGTAQGNVLISGCQNGYTVYQKGNGYDIQCAAGLVTIAGTHGANPYGAQTAPAIPASGTALTNPFPVTVRVFVSGGTVSAIAINGTDTGLTSGQITLGPGETITLTYTAAPAWTWFGL